MRYWSSRNSGLGVEGIGLDSVVTNSGYRAEEFADLLPRLLGAELLSDGTSCCFEWMVDCIIDTVDFSSDFVNGVFDLVNLRFNSFNFVKIKYIKLKTNVKKE